MGNKIVTLGEIMLYLSTSENIRFVRLDSLDVVYGGGSSFLESTHNSISTCSHASNFPYIYKYEYK